ncbi:protein of unknown function [Nitrospira defluvii]|jgi:hypothetical protein|uniref:Uncharacterized protein n=1 Tax=Nitrospira defluvii TaxID=330214 RepID=D8P8P9_9BACT|nr:protein of unknown function [Nitrospira defluvii]
MVSSVTSNGDETEQRLLQANELVTRLTLFRNGKVKMTSAQVSAAKIVIRKSIPAGQGRRPKSERKPNDR